jgi:Flp pilus assembly protein TadG
VEVAIVLPMFLTVVFALFEFGHFLIMRDTATDAAREAARAAMAFGASASVAENQAQAVLASVGARNATVTLTPSTITDHTAQVTVDVTIPFNDSSFFLPPIFMRNATIRGTCTLACEGYRAANGLYARPAPPGAAPAGETTWEPLFDD